MSTLIALGDAVKMRPDGMIEGYLVRFGDENNTDLVGDYFTKDTDFGRPFVKGVAQPLNLYYAHGMDTVIGKKAIGTGVVKMDDVGLWFEAQIDQSDAYKKKIAEMASMKHDDGTPRLGYSSGAASHLVEKEAVKDATGAIKAWKITTWPLGEGSATPAACEPQNTVTAKSLLLTETQFAKRLGVATKDAMVRDWDTDADELFAGIGSDLISDGLYTLFRRICYMAYQCFDDVDVQTGKQRALAAVAEFSAYATRYISAVVDAVASEETDEDEDPATRFDVDKEASMMKSLFTGQHQRPHDIKSFEKFLREAGNYSRKEATAIASKGFQALQRDAGPMDATKALTEEERQALEAEVLALTTKTLALTTLGLAKLPSFGEK